MEYFSYFDSPIGVMTLAEEDGSLTVIRFPHRPRPAGAAEEETPLLREAARQLAEYFDGRRRVFDLPLAPRGTPFQHRVWEALKAIPYGETRTYGQVAAAVGNPRACRAVGMANHYNPLPIVIPCHRVLGANGALTGFGGGLDIKQFLLALEREA